MGVGILRMFLVLMVIVSFNQPVWPSEENGILVNKDEILQRMKVREESLWLQQLRLEKEIADLEAKQKTPAPPALHLERKNTREQSTREHSAAEHTGEEDTDPGLPGEAWKRVVIPINTFVLLTGISISLRRSIRKRNARFFSPFAHLSYTDVMMGGHVSICAGSEHKKYNLEDQVKVQLQINQDE